jgi:hypothetical protein
MRLSILLILLLFRLVLPAQQQLGMRMDNYNTIQAMQLNPAFSTDMRSKWELNLLSVGASISNSYFYIENTSILSMLSNTDRIGPNPKLKDIYQIKGATIFYNFYDYKKTSFGAFQTTLTGPSLLFKINKNTTVGLFNNLRCMLNADDVPTKLGYYEYDRQLYYDAFDIEPFSINVMAWGEMGINFSKKLEFDDHNVSFGINAKYLAEIASAYFENKSLGRMAKITKDTIRFDDIEFETGIVPDYTSTEKIFNKHSSGGLGVDLGFSYTIHENDDDHYTQRFGVSITDIGAINFNKGAESHYIDRLEQVLIKGKDYSDADPKRVTDKIRKFSQRIYADSLKSKIGEDYSIGLPTTLHVNFDRKIMQNIYVSALFSQNIPISKHQVKGLNIINITPRYQSYWFTASSPISLVNYQKLHVGLSLRIGPLSLGSDNFLPFIFAQDINSADVYFGLKVPPFSLRSGKRGKSKRGIKCYDF